MEKKEEEDALRLFKVMQDKKEEREQRKITKMRALGADYMKQERVRKLKKKLKKRSTSKIVGSDDPDDPDHIDESELKKLKKKTKVVKKKKRGEEVFREFSQFSSGSDGNGIEEEEDEDNYEDYYIEDDEEIYKTDHEFSCESDDEDEKVEIRLARTGAAGRRKKEVKEDEEEEKFACKKCGSGDHPEWILLCDSCDLGWHANCLRPTLLVIPEGQWFCPDCSHAKLLQTLSRKLEELEEITKKSEGDRRRKERIAMINVNLASVLPSSPA